MPDTGSQQTAGRRSPTTVALAGGLAACAVMVVASAVLWGQIPSDIQVPAHWGPDGQLTRHAGRTEALVFPPIALLAVLGLLFAAPKLESDPVKRRAGLPGCAAAMWLMTVMLSMIHVHNVTYALGHPLNLLPGPFLVVITVLGVAVVVYAVRQSNAIKAAEAGPETQ